ncbi:MAG: hypothetical protein H6510_14305 [Acidobacteria bacterium]|nr:hypothetical protein [Acidobacteriota bacterium]MCB9398982.1 hypothetical protein [Acidobacteriota bacterium]
MKKLGFVCLLTAMVACGPRPFSNLHMVSLPETNGGQALPLHIIPVDATLLIKVTSMSPEDWFVSDVVMTTSGIHKRVFSGAQKEIVKIERKNDRNDFVVVVDYANVDNVDQQRILIGKEFQQSKDIYLLVGKEAIRIVDKKVYEDFLRNF